MTATGGAPGIVTAAVAAICTSSTVFFMATHLQVTEWLMPSIHSSRVVYLDLTQQVNLYCLYFGKDRLANEVYQDAPRMLPRAGLQRTGRSLWLVDTAVAWLLAHSRAQHTQPKGQTNK